MGKLQSAANVGTAHCGRLTLLDAKHRGEELASPRPAWSNAHMFRVLLLGLLMLGSADEGQSLTMYADPIPGLISKSADGQNIEGPAADLLRKIADYAGLEIQLMLAPTARSMIEVGADPQSCVAGVIRTESRDAAYKWAGVVARGRMVVYTRADDAFTATHVAELKGRTIGAVRNSVAAAWLKEQGLNYYEVGDQATSLRMLQLKRIDLWATRDLTAYPIIKEFGGTAPRIAYVVRVDDAYIACNRQMADDTIDRLSLAITRLRREGGLAAFGVR